MVVQRHYNTLKEGRDVWNKWRKEHPEILPDLRNADLHEYKLDHIDLRRTNLDGANLRNANLSSALLDGASFYQADLSGAKLRNAVLHKTCFKETILQHTNFHEAFLQDTMFLRVDLSETTNLENAFHLGASTIGIDTVQCSKGKIPEVFLRGAGVLEQLITGIKSSGVASFNYCTCFISHSSDDQKFVKVLYKDLCNAGVLCWYAPTSLYSGDKFRLHITEAVQSREKVLVVLSKKSLKSDWVKKEVELARQKERNGKKVLVPIRLDNAILTAKVNWATAIPNRRHIGNFENWQQSSSHYKEQLEGLLNALRKP